jgi:hypothetical protein
LEVATVYTGTGWLVIESRRAPTIEEIEADRPEHLAALKRSPQWAGSRAVWPTRVGEVTAFAAPGAKPLRGGNYENQPINAMRDDAWMVLKCRDHPPFKMTVGEIRALHRYPHFAP